MTKSQGIYKTRTRWKPEPSDVRGTCVACERRPQRTNGRGTFKPICRKCDKIIHGAGLSPAQRRNVERAKARRRLSSLP